MKILVAVKRVIDPYVKIRVMPDHLGVETQNVKMAMNPFDEIAVEEALRLRESHWATEVVVVSIGSDATQETLRHALALGADRAIHVRSEQAFESINIAKILKKIVEIENPALMLMGKQAIDGDNNQTPQMLAALLHWPQATNASKIRITEDKAEVVREIDGGLETIKVHLPAVISTDLRLNEPRYASLPNIMKSKQKPINTMTVQDLNLSLKSHSEILKVSPPLTRSGGTQLASVEELINKLQYEAKVL